MSFSFYLRHKIKTWLIALWNYLKSGSLKQDLKKVGKQIYKHRFVYFLAIIFIFLLIFRTINTFFEIYTVEGNSMSPNFLNGDVVLLENFSGTLAEWLPTLKRGDVIVFIDVRNAEKKEIPPKLIKRILGLPGENIFASDENVLIQDSNRNIYTVDKDYNLVVDNSQTIGSTTFLGPVDYYVVGDNRKNSRDSRSFGTVQPTEMLGRVIYEF